MKATALLESSSISCTVAHDQSEISSTREIPTLNQKSFKGGITFTDTNYDV